MNTEVCIKICKAKPEDLFTAKGRLFLVDLIKNVNLSSMRGEQVFLLKGI